MKNLLIPCLLALYAAAATAATPVFSDNFQTYPAGVLPEGGSSPWLPRPEGKTNDDGSGIITRVVEDTELRFGPSGSGKYLRLSRTPGKGEAQNVAIDGHKAGSVAAVELTFLLPQEDTAAGPGYVLRAGNAAGNANTAFAIIFKDGALWQAQGPSIAPAAEPLKTVETGKPQQLRMVMNNSTGAIHYGPQQTALPAESMDVWLGGERIGVALPKSGGSDGSGIRAGMGIDSLSFNAKSTTRGTLLIGEIALIPQP